VPKINIVHAGPEYQMLVDGEAIVKTPAHTRRCQSYSADARAAVREFHAGVSQPDMAFVLFFCSSEYDLDALADEMQRQFAGVQVIGCTTAGEIGPAGYRDHSITGASFATGSFAAVSGLIGPLREFDLAAGEAFAQAQLQKLECLAPRTTPDKTFALLLIDGLSIREEPVTRVLQNALGDIPLVGGSAGDGLNFHQTHVYFGGRFQADAAVVVLVTTALPFRIFKIQHFVPTEERLVVTDADATCRLVREINGLRADEEYARIGHIDPKDLQPTQFASSPMVVLIDGTYYVRSIQRVNQDGSLTFYCAIEEGLVLRVARGVDLVANMAAAFAQIQSEIGVPELVLGCDCILRKLEISEKGLIDQVSHVFERNNGIGFNTYGEQYRGIHVNQTLTGIAIGRGASERSHG
jgi:hypothetical protein